MLDRKYFLYLIYLCVGSFLISNLTSPSFFKIKGNLGAQKLGAQKLGAQKEFFHDKKSLLNPTFVSISEETDKHYLLEKNEASKMETDTFKLFNLTSSKIDLFYKRRGESRKSSLEILGLKFNEERFQVHEPNDLPRKVSIALPKEGVKSFKLHRIDFKNNKNFVWVGQEEGNQWLNLHISYYRGYFAGSFNTERGNYEISYLLEDVYVLRKINPHSYPMGCEAQLHTSYRNLLLQEERYQENSTDLVLSDSDLEGFSSQFKNQTQNFMGLDTIEYDPIDKQTREPPQNVVLDIIIGYSHRAEIIKGGPNPTMALINLALSKANTAHLNSPTGIRLNLKETVKLHMKPSEKLVVVLDRLQQATENLLAGQDYDSDDPYQVLANRKIQLNADLGFLFTEKKVDLCGKGFYAFNFSSSPDLLGVNKSHMFSAQPITCPPYIFAHETGHNFRLYHNRPKSSVTKHYGFGFKLDTMENPFRTVMSRRCKNQICPVILYYSTPFQKYKDVIIGEENRVDATRHIRERAAIVRDLYQSTDSPQIIEPPQGGSIIKGGSLRLSVHVLSDSPVSYRWYKDGEFIPGEINSDLILDFSEEQASFFDSSHTYYVQIVNESGLTLSDPVEVLFVDTIHSNLKAH